MASLDILADDTIQPTHIDATRLSGHRKVLTQRINTMCADLMMQGYVPSKLYITPKQYGYIKRSKELQEYDHRLYKPNDRIYVNEHCAMELEIKKL